MLTSTWNLIGGHQDHRCFAWKLYRESRKKMPSVCKKRTSWWFQPLWKILLNFTQNGYLPQIGVNIKKKWKHQPEKFFEVWSGWVQVVFCCTLQFFNKSDMSWASPFAWKYSPELRNMRLENHGAQSISRDKTLNLYFRMAWHAKSFGSPSFRWQVWQTKILGSTLEVHLRPFSSLWFSEFHVYWITFQKQAHSNNEKKQNNHEQNW